MGGQVYAGGGEDTIVRVYEKGVQPETPVQVATQGRFTRGTQGWGLLSNGQRSLWANAAKGVKSKSKRRIKAKAISGQNLYTALTSKFLQVNPNGLVPQEPPAERFHGDLPTFTTVIGGGAVTITASGPNAAGVTTEIFIQKLGASYLKPKGKIPHATFYTFTSGGSGLSRVLPLSSGAYAFAVQFVKTSTGEAAGFQTLGTQILLAAVQGGLEDAPKLRKAA